MVLVHRQTPCCGSMVDILCPMRNPLWFASALDMEMMQPAELLKHRFGRKRSADVPYATRRVTDGPLNRRLLTITVYGSRYVPEMCRTK